MNGAGSSETGDFPLAQVRRVIDVCDRFETALIAGLSPRIESYLSEMEGIDSLSLFRELLTLEVEYRARSGWIPESEEYQTRFPEHAALILSVFEEVSLSTIGSSLHLEANPSDSTEELVNPNASTASDTVSTRFKSGRKTPTATPGLRDYQEPQTIGRYQVEGVLGVGGFGRVFKAFDADLNRRVAIKVPHPSRIRTPKDIESYLTEARILASLDHPGIVPVFDFGRSEDGHCYIVSKLIEGSDLAMRLRLGRPSYRETTRQVAAIAEAAHYAHTRNLVHRDIKTRNILIDPTGRPYLVDFGLALKEEDFGKGPNFAGTPVYMSPEQARGEGHLVDGRSDVFSLGVVLYEMLVGSRPFKGGGWTETIERIKTQEVRPPRQLDGTIPKELERICLKALAKRVTDRFATAQEMADDLVHALAQLDGSGTFEMRSGGASSRTEGETSALSLHIVPKGLRCFEAEDADFFLKLLPGPRDRDDLPDSLRFWKSRIEANDTERAFRVGLVYGPSGCGKSSLVKAGLVPRLDAQITPILIEATSKETEARLENALRKQFDAFSSESRLPEMLGAIRRGTAVPEGGKVLLVLDQFEQWLHANRGVEDSEFVQALRQCDGIRLQCLLIVRDDFWMSVTRFMQELEVRVVEGQNCAAVDLFSVRHARQVLVAFGRAFEALPAYPTNPTKDQHAFINQAVEGLAQDDRVVCVQLSLFAEMVKDRSWTHATLKDVGGTQGVGVTFLDETFNSTTSPPEYHRHQRAMRQVLQALLPEIGTEIRGHMRSRTELLEATEGAGTQDDFDELLRILDTQLRLITPTDPEGVEPSASSSPEPHYQLAHDYLVPSLRDWLTQKQRETRRGRAEIRLAERAALWGTKQERRQLPSFFEWLDIRLATARSLWNEREAKLMHAARAHHTVRFARGFLVLLSATAVGMEGYTYVRARSLVEGLFVADTAKVSEIIPQMAPYRRWANLRLRDAKARAKIGSQELLRASLALLPIDRSQEHELVDQLLESDPPNVRIIGEALAPGSADVKRQLWEILEAVHEPMDRRLRAACTLASFEPASPRWSAVAADVVSALTSEDLFAVAHWSDLLRPVHDKLHNSLQNVFISQSDNQRGYVAASLLAEYAQNRNELILELIKQADPKQVRLLLSTQSNENKPRLATLVKRLLATPSPSGAEPKVLNQLARAKANAALAMAILGSTSTLWDALENRPDPRLRAYLIDRLPGFELDPLKLLEVAEQHPVPSVRQALILSLEGFGDNLLPQGIRDTLLPRLLDRYREDPDPGVHSALDWLLRRWSFDNRVNAADLELAKRPPKPGHQWRVNGQRHTMVFVEGPVTFQMGSPPDEDGRESIVGMYEPQHTRRISRTFEIASKEITVEQYTASPIPYTYDDRILKTSQYPVIRATFYDAARYCRWLSEQEGIAEDQMCYPKMELIKPGFSMMPDYLTRTGYRLPTEAEWEAACRAGTTTSRYYGTDLDLIKQYAWCYPHAEDLLHPVGLKIPNTLGLFDMLGNVYERCLGPNPKIAQSFKGTVEDTAENVDLPRHILGDDFLVIRGGAYHRSEEALRSAARNGVEAGGQNIRAGFRIARTLRSFSPPPQTSQN